MSATPNTPGSNTLNPLDFPLWGSRLIEASAGTGKTWTIAALYLRLVLGHGGEAGFVRPLLPSEILVMTFTRAATRELSDRIRARLLEAAKVFRGEAQAAAHDAMLSALLADYPEGPSRSAAAWRLGLAAESMDDAAVHTIDAWCQRMLREHAFDSGCLFHEELIGDEQELLLEATQDYWRAQVYPLATQALDQALMVFARVDSLAQDARQLLAQDLPMAADVSEPLAALIERAQAAHAAQLAALKRGWAEAADRMQAFLDGQMEGKTCPFNKTKLRPGYYQPWLQALRDWAQDPALTQPEISEAGLRRLVPSGLAEAVKPDAAAPSWPPEFQAFADLLAALAALQGVATPMRLHAAACIGARLAELKAKTGLFGFADMLNRLDRALDPATQGASAERLRQGMLAQYPVALIDEFQDTSPLQARIFDRLYRLADNARDSALLLIGDPKQSIYGFRGADIYSYLEARRKTSGRHYMLGTNHRSSLALVAAVNQVFVHAEQREGAGAFMFRSSGAEANPLPFAPVAARGRAETLVCSAGPVPALSVQVDAQLRDANSSLRLFAARCAEQIALLLNDEAAGFVEPASGRFERLRPADIAVLVRTGREAATLRRELRRRQIASVYLSDKDSVFASAEARDLLRVLQAVAEPLNMRLVRAALATRLLGLSLKELAHLAQDDEAFDARSDELKALQSIWLSQGVLAMLRELLHAFALPSQWLAQDERGAKDADGERRLTNVLHLAELLQAASHEQGGEQALIRWLAAQIEAAQVPGAAAGEGAVLRLESDADLVKVVTVHKSKGLEYPLVFMPFAASFRAVDKARTRFVKQQALPDSPCGEAQLHLAPSAEQLAQADRERLREDLRLLYVALTRARHALWLGVAALKVRNGKSCETWRSAIGYVLGGEAAFSEDQLQALAQALAAGNSEIAVQAAASGASLGPSLLNPRAAPSPLKAAQAYQAEFERRWGIGSFSALVRALPQRAVSSELARLDEGHAATDQALLQDAPRQQDALATQAALLPPWHRFPRGAFAGNFLHDLLEWLAEEGFDRLASSEELQAQLLRRCERQGWGNWAGDVLLWLQQLCATPLPPVGCALQALRGHLPEMEFWFPAERLQASALDALCRRHLLGEEARPELPQRQLQGLLMGFADLVFEHQGRYFVLDYKSNHLGEGDADYHEAALQAAMAQHRYDVQAALYLLALHRLLRARLGEAYRPAQHLGGAVYVFMRGMQGPAQGCYWVQPSEALLNELDLLLDNKPAELPAPGEL